MKNYKANRTVHTGLLLSVFVMGCELQITQTNRTEEVVRSCVEGFQERRTRFQDALVASEALCQAEEQVRSCVNGIMSEFSGRFEAVSCQVVSNPIPEPRSCGNLAHGDNETRSMFEVALVPHGSSCVSETQIRSCTDGQLSSFSGSFSHASCQIAESPYISTPAPQSPNPVVPGDADEGAVYSNEILKVETPSSLIAGEEVTVKIHYSSNTDNEIKVDLKRYSLNQLIVASNVRVSRGENNVLNIQMTVPSTVSANTNDSRFLAYIVPQAKGWPERYHQLWSASLDLSSSVVPTPTNPAPSPTLPTDPIITGTGCNNGSAEALSQFGVTWFFDREYTCGTFANGDFWVVGPVSITNITPESGVRVETLSDGRSFNRIVNGTLVNPMVYLSVDPQTPNGYDNAVSVSGKSAYGGAAYSSGANKAPSITGQALVANAGTSVVSSISSGSLPENSSYPQIRRIVALTVLGAVPPAGSFRPPMIGNDKTIRWNRSQLNYNILRKLSPVQGTPSLAAVENEFSVPWTMLHTGNWTQNMTPMQMPNYGRDQAYAISRALLSLHLDYTDAQKERLYISLVQYGIDIYGFVSNGGFTRASGGLNGGRKAALVLAAAALNAQLLKEWANAGKKTAYKPYGKSVNIFHEDSQVWIVGEGDVGRAVTQDGAYRETYRAEHVGLPEWGNQHENYPVYDASNWSVAYRDIANSSHIGNALGIRLLSGGEAIWNNPVFFSYYLDRAWSIEGSGTWDQQTMRHNRIPLFDFNMMKSYGQP